MWEADDYIEERVGLAVSKKTNSIVIQLDKPDTDLSDYDIDFLSGEWIKDKLNDLEFKSLDSNISMQEKLVGFSS